MEYDTAGCPIKGQLWTRRTTASVADQINACGIAISDRTVARLLKQLGYALRVNHKTIATTNPPERDEQFGIIAALRTQSDNGEIPLLSIDCKKKEMVGKFKNPGAKWGRTPEHVNDHDFRSLASALAVPYGIYDVNANCGSFHVGQSYDTPQFAVDCIVRWWLTEGRVRYPDATELVILADCGGSNGYRCRAWKYFLQHNFVNRFNVTIIVAHYPAGASKWNPIEHRLFSEVSKNWAGEPLESFEIILRCLQSTTTAGGLTVTAGLVETVYEKGIKISNEQMNLLNCEKGDRLPQWNYTIKPQQNNVVATCNA